MINKEVELVLRNVLDPITGQDLVTAGRIGEISRDEKHISCTLVFTQALTEQQKTSLNFACLEVLQRRFPNLESHLHLETQLRKGVEPRSVLPQVTNIIAVASGKGGVGKSTVSTNLAISLKTQGHRVGLIDADLYGPSIPTMLGLEGQRPKLQDVHGKAKIIPLEVYGIEVMSIGFIVEPEQAVVLRGPRLAGIIKQFIQDCLWSELDFLIIDLPPGTGDIQLTVVQTVPVTGAIVVTTPQKVAVADAIKAMNMFRLPSIDVPILGVVENMSWFTPPDLPHQKYYLFGKGGGQQLAAESASVLLGQLPIVESIRQASDDGLPIVLDDNHKQLQEHWKEITNNVIQQTQARNEKTESYADSAGKTVTWHSMTALDKEQLLTDVEEALDDIRPHLVVDGGNVELVDITDDYFVQIRWLGSCKTCNMTAMTMKAGIEQTIKHKVAQIRGIEAVNDPQSERTE